MNVNEFARETREKGKIKKSVLWAKYNKLDEQDVVVRAEHLCVHV